MHLRLAAALLALLPQLAPAATADDALLDAVRGGDLAQARRLLAAHADPNRPLPDGSTLLAWAVEAQNRDMVQLLLARGARASGVGDAGVAPLLVACEYGDATIIASLLDAGADARAARADGITALALCAGSAPAATLGRLIAAGAGVEQADARGQTPLMWAAARGRIDNLALLLQHGAQINRRTDKGFTPLFFALKSGVPAAPVAMLEAGGDAGYVAPDGTSAVQLAMYQKDYAFAARLIARGVQLEAVDRGGNRLLHAAILAGQPELVRLLLASGADPDATTGAATVKMRFESNFKSGDYAVPPKSPLQLAAEHGDATMMQMLIDAGAHPRTRASDGSTLAMAAAAGGKLAALQLALRVDPEPNAADHDGQTPLHVLLSTGTGAEGAGREAVAMMQLLADHGARIDLKNRDGHTAADLADAPQFPMKAAFDAIFRKQTVNHL